MMNDSILGVFHFYRYSLAAGRWGGQFDRTRNLIAS